VLAPLVLLVQFTEKHGFFTFLKVVVIAGVTLGVQWQ
jgi:hypothetical protein